MLNYSLFAMPILRASLININRDRTSAHSCPPSGFTPKRRWIIKCRRRRLGFGPARHSRTARRVHVCQHVPSTHTLSRRDAIFLFRLATRVMQYGVTKRDTNSIFATQCTSRSSVVFARTTVKVPDAITIFINAAKVW